MDELKVFTGNSHPELVKRVTDYLGIPLGRAEVFQFSNENIFVRILENVRERDTFVIQPLSSPVSQNIIELLIMIDALKRASAKRITAVIPYYGYGRTDKKDQPRVPITARLLADLLTAAGANRLLTVDLHAAQIQGFFNIPVDELTALNILADYFKQKKLDSNLVVVATDIGIAKRARDLAAMLQAPLALMEKRRLGNMDETETLNVIGDVDGKVALTVDDEIDTAGSLANTVDALLERGATEVFACATHPVFSNHAIKRIAASQVKEVVVTDTIPMNKEKLGKITVLPIASLLGEAIHRIHTGMSIGAMFD
jgi:ribose-phosphate pyrophosphokinase